MSLIEEKTVISLRQAVELALDKEQRRNPNCWSSLRTTTTQNEVTCSDKAQKKEVKK